MSFYEDRILPHFIQLSVRQGTLAAYRRRLVSAAEGRVLEIGIGSGLNVPHYRAMSWLFGVGLFVALLWALFRGVRPGETREKPEAILRRRYASGEIDTDEFERRLSTLREGRDAA